MNRFSVPARCSSSTFPGFRAHLAMAFDHDAEEVTLTIVHSEPQQRVWLSYEEAVELASSIVCRIVDRT